MNDEWTLIISVEDVNTGEKTNFPASKERIPDVVLVHMLNAGRYRINGRDVYMGRPTLDFTARTITYIGEIL